MKRIILLLISVALIAQFGEAKNKQPIEFVNHFIGSGNNGNTYPGAQAPFGMISISPNTTYTDYNSAYTRSGYKYEAKEIYGFGLTHFSGVGCHAMQDVQFLPVSGNVDISPVNKKGAYKSAFSHDHESASPGYYAVTLEDYNIDIEFTANQRSGIGEINYNGGDSAFFVFQPTNSANGIGEGFVNIETEKNRFTGMVSSGGFCWRDPKDRPYKVFFVFQFDKTIMNYGIWKNETKIPGIYKTEGDDFGAYLSFGKDAGMVKMKVGISYVSVENAIDNLNAEITGSFDSELKETQQTWNKYLNKIAVEGGTADEKTIFYTALYHNLLVSNVFSDINGQYIGFDDQIHTIEKGRTKYANFSLWDTYRTTSYLQALVAPEAAADMIQSLYLDAQQGGSFPNWSMNNVEFGVMNGYSPFPFIANMHALGINNFDLQGVKDMMKKVSVKHIPCKGHHGWYNVDEYMKLGYVPVDKSGYGTSMTIEYGIDDYSIAKICQSAGDTDAADYYFKRSQNVFNLYNPELKFIQAKDSDGKFVKNFTAVSEEGFNEGNALQYFWSIPHSMSKLVDLAGGNEFMEQRLDSFVSKLIVGWAPDQPYLWVGNEPCFGAVQVYNYIQRPYKAQQHARLIMTETFKNTPDGLPGDDDAGAMSALYVFQAIGLYPYLPGEGGFSVTGPLFEKTTITLGNGKKVMLKAKGAKANAPYIQSMKINGKPNTKLWIDWNTLSKGATLNYKMGAEPNKSWGSNKDDVPPSYYPEK